MNTDQLKQRCDGNPVKFALGSGGLPCLDVETPLAQARVYLYGAHVAHYQPAGQQPVLFMSRQAIFQPGKPIRGGVPVCHPWFGPKADDPGAPMHGVVRLQDWTVFDIKTLAGGEVEIAFEQADSELSRKYWPHAFRAEYRVRVGRELTLSLFTRNTGTTPCTLNEALHTYFTVGDVKQIAISGLENTQYIDKTRNMQRFTEAALPITITGETDRHYVNTPATVTINDPSMKRRIIISKAGSQSTVVWNPWIAKAAALADFGDDEWTSMVCVETANAYENAITIAPGAAHEMQATIRVA